MADAIRHARSVSPWFIPNKAGSADDLHGLTDISGGVSVDREDVYVIGKETKCGTDKDIPEGTLSLTQLERGEINSYLVLANLASEPVGGLSLSDFDSSLVDVFLYGREEFNGTVEQTIWFPKTALDTINIDIADPEARIERSFDVTGDNKYEFNNSNAYGIHVKDTAGSGVSGNYVIDVSDPAPVADPNNSGQYMLRIDRTRSSVTTTLTFTTDYTFNNGTGEITIVAGLTGDVYNIYYSAGSFGALGDPTTVDSASTCFLKAENVTVLIEDSTNPAVELDLLTSLSISATFNRISEAVIGNDQKILKATESRTVDLSLTGRVKDSTFGEAFMNQLGQSWGISVASLYEDDVKVTVKIYSDATKSTFLLGYQVDGLSFSDDNTDFTANEFGTIDLTASSDNLLITTVEGNL